MNNIKNKKIIYRVIVLFILVSVISGTILYINVFAPNVDLKDDMETYLYIPTANNYNTQAICVSKWIFLST